MSEQGKIPYSEMNLHQKIVEIMKRIEYLKKDDTVAFANTKYKAISEEKVTIAVRTALVEVGVTIVPVDVVLTKEQSLSTVSCKYQITNAHDPRDFIIAASVGQGADTQDKGSGKALTYAYKYLLLRTIAIPTGEDPDKISSDELDEDDKNRKIAEAKKAADAAKKADEAKNAGTAGDVASNAGAQVDVKDKLLDELNNAGIKSVQFFADMKITTKAHMTAMYGVFKHDKKDVRFIDAFIFFYKAVNEAIASTGNKEITYATFSEKMKVNSDMIKMCYNNKDKIVGMVEIHAGA